MVTNDRWGPDVRCKHGGFWTCHDRWIPGIYHCNQNDQPVHCYLTAQVITQKSAVPIQVAQLAVKSFTCSVTDPRFKPSSQPAIFLNSFTPICVQITVQ